MPRRSRRILRVSEGGGARGVKRTLGGLLLVGLMGVAGAVPEARRSFSGRRVSEGTWLGIGSPRTVAVGGLALSAADAPS